MSNVSTLKGESVTTVEPFSVIATPFAWPVCEAIPRRQWLYDRHLIRGFVSATVAASGVGKSTLKFAECLSMVSARALLHGAAPSASLNVWIWNGEDPREELERRIAAAAKHYSLTQDDCAGSLFVDSGRDQTIVIAETTRTGTLIVRPVVDAIKAELKRRKIDVLIVDPFVSSHRVSENDNNAIDAVAREWAGIANDAQCAIELVHHSRKTGGGEVTIEDARGASALIAASRSARVINPMSPDEAARAGVDNPRAYFRSDNGKSSMSPPSDKATWFRLVSVDIGNASEDEPGDHVGVVEAWTWPDPLDEVSVHDLRAVQAIVAGGSWRANIQAADWVGHAVAQALRLDASNKQHKAKIIGLLKIWKSTGMLVEVEGKDEKRKPRTFVEVGTPAND